MKRVILLFFSAFFLVAAPAVAKDVSVELWKVSERSGDVQLLRSGLQPASLHSDGQLKPGDIVATGATGRAVLTRSADYVIVAPNSRVQLPPAQAPDGVTRFFQQAGTLLYKVRRMGVPHFQVQTPMLAAVVKGTTFTVIVDRDRSAVQVTEGKVEVAAVTGGMTRLVMPGETVFINRENPSDLVLASLETVGVADGGPNEMVRIVGTSPEPLSAIGTLTGGLVQAAITAPIQIASLEALTVVTPAPAPAVAPGVSVPPASTPEVTTPPVTVPPVTTPEVTVPPVTLPPVTTPPVTLPPVTLPPLTTPEVTVPPVTLPPVTTPPVTLPPVTLPPVTLPPVTLPPVTVPLPLGL